MKILKKVMLSVIIILLLGNYIVFASDLTNGVQITTSNNFGKAGNSIFGVVRTVGIICAVAALMLIGIKYMLASVEERAEYKKTFTIYLVGVVLVFGIVTLVEFVYNWINSVL